MSNDPVKTGRSGDSRYPYVSLGIALALLSWQAAHWYIGNPGLFPSVLQIAQSLGRWFQSGAMRVDLNASVPRAVLGLLLSIPIGISIGIALAMSQRTKLMLGPLIHLLRSMPPVALLPLFVLWFGINEGAKLTATTFVCIFPIAVTTWQAAEIVDSSYRELGRDLRLGAWRYLKLVVFPGSLPSIVPGIRLAAGTSLVMVYVSELAGATAGLGYRISISQLAFQAGLMISSLIVLGIIGLLMDLALSRFFNRILHYAGK